MKFRIKHALVVLFHTFILRPISPIVVLVGVFFAKKSNRVTTHYGQDPKIQRYVLPSWLGWFNTPDEDGFPLYEPTVKKIYDKFGWRVCMFYNLGLRNQAQGFLWNFGWECSENLRNKNKGSGYKILNTVVDLKLFNLKFYYGWEVARDHYKSHTKSGFLSIPQLGITTGETV